MDYSNDTSATKLNITYIIGRSRGLISNRVEFQKSSEKRGKSLFGYGVGDEKSRYLV